MIQREFTVELQRVKSLIASFGFDIDFVLRRMAEEKYERVILVALYTSDEAFRRVEKAYHTLSILCTARGIKCSLERIAPENTIRGIYTLLQREAEEADQLDIYLTGGPRILVTALLLTTLILPSDYLKKTKIIVEGEGFECTLEVDTSTYTKRIKLEDRFRNIIMILDTLEKAKLSELTKHTDISKSSLYRKLKDMEHENLVECDEKTATYTAKNPIKILCKK